MPEHNLPCVTDAYKIEGEVSKSSLQYLDIRAKSTAYDSFPGSVVGISKMDKSFSEQGKA